MLVGEKIRNARVHVGMTQSDLADKLKCSEKTISRIEHNKKELTLEEVKHINEIFGIDLLVEEDDKIYTLISIFQQVKYYLLEEKCLFVSVLAMKNYQKNMKNLIIDIPMA